MIKNMVEPWDTRKEALMVLFFYFNMGYPLFDKDASL